MKESLLLHHCCAPCSPRAVERFRERFSVSSLWFNPNIHPAAEHEQRKSAMVSLASFMQLDLETAQEGSQREWLDCYAKRGGDRCTFCYVQRLEKTAQRAKERGIGCISTTLLSSPYQKHDLVRSLGTAIAVSAGIEFVYEDLRPWFYEGKSMARRFGLYSQKFCGCIFSMREREKELGKKLYPEEQHR